MTALEIAVVVPTLNEVDNVLPLLERLEVAFAGARWEAIFVDDASTDGTTQRLIELASERSHVRVIRRVGRRGLASAVMEGFLSTTAQLVGVLDADLQHDEQTLRAMFELVQTDGYDLVSASRFLDPTLMEGLDPGRERLSGLGIRMANRLTGRELTDPLSGCFVVRRDLVERLAPKVSLKGFKILLDLLAASPPTVRTVEVPIRFSPRHAGQSKLDALVSLEFLTVFVDRVFRGVIPVRFVAFMLIGAGGVVLHLTVLGGLMIGLGVGFLLAQAVATYVAMVSNFVLNNLFTYRDLRLRGRRFARGLVVFVVVCSVGAAANLAIAEQLFGLGVTWWIAGLLGGLIGAVWNFAVSGSLVWRTLAGATLRASEA
jgi:dolichol-phosphate mannosyltransferase